MGSERWLKQLLDMWGMGPLKDLLDTLALYGITEGEGWSPVHAERKGWILRIQQQEGGWPRKQPTR